MVGKTSNSILSLFLFLTFSQPLIGSDGGSERANKINEAWQILRQMVERQRADGQLIDDDNYPSVEECAQVLRVEESAFSRYEAAHELALASMPESIFNKQKEQILYEAVVRIAAHSPSDGHRLFENVIEKIGVGLYKVRAPGMRERVMLGFLLWVRDYRDLKLCEGYLEVRGGLNQFANFMGRFLDIYEDSDRERTKARRAFDRESPGTFESQLSELSTPKATIRPSRAVKSVDISLLEGLGYRIAYPYRDLEFNGGKSFPLDRWLIQEQSTPHAMLLGRTARLLSDEGEKLLSLDDYSTAALLLEQDQNLGQMPSLVDLISVVCSGAVRAIIMRDVKSMGDASALEQVTSEKVSSSLRSGLRQFHSTAQILFRTAPRALVARAELVFPVGLEKQFAELKNYSLGKILNKSKNIYQLLEKGQPAKVRVGGREIGVSARFI